MKRKITYQEAVWTSAFIGVTAAAVSMELFAAFRKHQSIPAWTTLTVRYIPKPVALAAAAYLSTWLPIHLLKYYKLQGKLC